MDNVDNVKIQRRDPLGKSFRVLVVPAQDIQNGGPTIPTYVQSKREV